MEEDKGEKQRALLASLTDERVRLRALSLMRDAARRFTSQDKRVVEGFHVASMAAEVFRNLCMRALQLSLSKLELGALLLHIYGLPCIETGAVNSQDFIKQFVAMGVRERNEEAAERKKREEANKKTAQDSKSKEGVNKGTTRLEDFTFDEADEARAVEKLTTASVRFDRGSTLRGPQTAAFDAFQASVLTPSTLKDGLKVLLGVSLSRKELNALFLRYSRELSGSSLTGVWFFRQFLKLGEERRNALKAEEDARLAAKKAMQLEMDLRAKYENVLLVADLSFTPSDEVSAKAKLRKAARTYEGGGMEELYSSNSLSPHQLRAVLRRELRLSAALTAAEIGAISSLFPSSHQIQIQQQMKQPEPNDNADLKKIRSDFSINGATFVAFFLRLVAEEKRLVKSSQMVKERQRTANEIVRDELLKRKTIDGDSNSTVVNFDFTEADRSATLLKLSNFAGRYDKHSLSAVDLTAFEGLLMSPTVLRQTLLKVAGMRLNAKELGVLMKEFSRSGEESVVRSSDFLAAFARAGIEQRKLWAQARLHIEEHRAAREKEKERKRAQLEETRQSGAADFEFDAKDEVAAEEKIRRAALSYDRLSTTAPSLNIFQAGLMSPAQLRSNLRKVFGVYLSSKELGALFRKHDPKCEGFIHSRIFLRAFLTLSQELRAPLLRRRPETCPDTLHLVTEDPKQNDENIIDWKYDAEHFDAACALLELKLLRADTDQFQVFNGMQMTALQVKEAIQRALNVLLSALELGALMGRLGARPPSDAPSSSMPAITIDSQVLKALLLRLRQSARNKEAQREQSDRRQQREKDAAEASREALLAQQRQRMAAQCSYLEEDTSSALRRLTAAAAKYDRSATGAVSLEAFNRSTMSALDFREHLKTIFGLLLTSSELAALVNEFRVRKSGAHDRGEDTNDGFIDCAVFLNAFIKMGTEERSKIRLIEMEKQRKKALIVKSTHERAMRQLERKKRITLNYLISEEQKEAAFVKLSTAAARYDKSDATAVPLDAFHVSSLSASEFREQLKRVFNIQATPSDLAAFLLLNNDDMPPAQDRVDCPKFLAHFLKLGITERDKMKQRLLSKARKIEEDRRKEEADRLAVATISKGYWLQESLETSGTLEESRAKALEKLSLSLQSYNIASLGAELLNAFRKAEFMDAASFKSELRQRFKLQLKTAEWTALCAYFLTKEANSDRIHCAAFLQHIKSMLRSSATSPAREVRLLEAPVDDRLKYEAGIDFEYSSDDFNSALEKIRQCCISSSSGIAEQLRGFQGPNFRPSEFKELLRQTLGIHLKPKEAGALIRYFPAEDGLSLCNADFVAYVLKTYRLETERQKRERRLKQSEKESTLRAQERNRSKEVVVELPFDSTDESSCLRKLTAAVLKFSTTSALYTEGLREIKDNSFRPKAFRERFYRIFQTSLTSKESRVLLSALDSSGSESIDGKSFLTAFYKLQRELAVRADISDNEMMSILRAEDCSRPLVSSFNSPIKPLTMTQPSIFKRVDRLKFIADRRPDSTPSPQLTKQERLLRMTKLEPLAASDASTAIFLLKDRRALKKQNERDEPAMSRGPTVPNKKTVNNPVSTRRREFVFPALLTSAPIFSLGGFESNSSSHLEEDASDQ